MKRLENNSLDFNIYYLNFSKIYEMAMMINNVLITKLETDTTNSFEEQYGYTASIEAKGTTMFLNGIKSSLSTEINSKSTETSKVSQSLEVKTTKSLLLQRVIRQCSVINSFEQCKEGDLIKISNIKLKLLNEESLRQFLILRRDALKGMQVEGVEINNLISSMLQDYAYILIGIIADSDQNPILIKIPMDIKSEFENQYSINDLLIGQVSIVGIYKGLIEESEITNNTFEYFQENNKDTSKKSSSNFIRSASKPNNQSKKSEYYDKYHYIDTLAIIQDINIKMIEVKKPKLHWWNRFGLWLSKKGIKYNEI